MVSIVKLLDNPVVIDFPASISYEGEYDNGTAYTTGDSVSYNGSSYVAVQSTTGNVPTNTTYWQLLAEKGDTGEGVAASGGAGQILAKASGTDYDTEWIDVSIDHTFETVNKNLKQYAYALNYSSGLISTIVYTVPSVGTITKTFNYTGDKVTSIVLSGDTPGSIDLTKTFTYSGDTLTNVSYS